MASKMVPWVVAYVTKFYTKSPVDGLVEFGFQQERRVSVMATKPSAAEKKVAAALKRCYGNIRKSKMYWHEWEIVSIEEEASA